MRRISSPPRLDWKQKVESVGLLYHTFDDKPYWFEAAYYQVSSREVDEIERATNELIELCYAGVDHVISANRWADLRIPEKVIPVIKAAWDADPPSLYGRFDLGYDGMRGPVLFEFNADTPTSLLEAAVAQWHWLEEVHKGADQFNSIWEALVTKWRALKDEGCFKGAFVHFAHADSLEDLMTITCLQDTAQEAGLQTLALRMDEIGWDPVTQAFVDQDNRRINTLFKLYPWEWMVHDEFSEAVLRRYSDTVYIEPIWKMILSNKAFLAILWELNPHHPHLLETYLDGPRGMEEYVKKPIFSREGSNVSIMRFGQEIAATQGEYGEEGYVYQRYYPLPNFEGNQPVIGSWVVDSTSCGIGIRETEGLITTDLARFVPHLIS